MWILWSEEVNEPIPQQTKVAEQDDLIQFLKKQ